jgi:hypothetical protein
VAEGRQNKDKKQQQVAENNYQLTMINNQLSAILIKRNKAHGSDLEAQSFSQFTINNLYEI